MSVGINQEYLDHIIFKELKTYSNFYKDISNSTMNWLSQGTSAITNIDTYVFSSMQGTLESIHDTLYKGRINDAYALLRKFYDSTIINLYTNLYLSDNFNIDNFIVSKIDNWLKGKEKIPSFETMSKYLISSPKLKEITEVIYKDGLFKGSIFEELRQRCNNHTHYLYYQMLLLNDNEIYSQNRLSALDGFSKDLKDIFILHLSNLFYLNDHYMMSSDYSDSIDIGVIPEEGSQYWVAPFVQNIFDVVIKPNRPDIVTIIKGKTTMLLE